MTSVKRCRICKKYKKNTEVRQVGISYQCLIDCSLSTRSEQKELNVPNLDLCHTLKKRKSKRLKQRVSKPIRNSACGEKCTLRVSPKCQDGETVVGCHLNTPFKGVALKSPDLWIVNACYECHLLLDSSQVDHKDQLRALFETQKLMLDKGLLVMK